MSVPNQKIIKINKQLNGSFLQINNKDWQEAYKKLKPSAFAIYLYLSSNQNGYNYELSQVDIENKLGIKKTAYHEAITQLIDFGYLCPVTTKNYEFQTTIANSANAEKSVNAEFFIS